MQQIIIVANEIECDIAESDAPSTKSLTKLLIFGTFASAHFILNSQFFRALLILDDGFFNLSEYFFNFSHCSVVVSNLANDDNTDGTSFSVWNL